MKYNVGDEVLLKAKIVSIDNNSTSGLSVRVEMPTEFYFWITEDEIVGVVEAEMPDTEPKVEVIPQAEVDAWHNAHESGKAEGYEQGLNDAWELARKIFTLNRTALNNAFGLEEKRSVFDELDVQTALAKLKAYEEAQIEVGDVVDVANGTLAIVTYANPTIDNYSFVDFTGMTRNDYKSSMLKKTGKHLDISSILEQIGE